MADSHHPAATFTPDTMHDIVDFAEKAAGPELPDIPTPGFECSLGSRSEVLQCIFQAAPSRADIKSAVAALRTRFSAEIDSGKCVENGSAEVYIGDGDWTTERAVYGDEVFGSVVIRVKGGGFYSQVHFDYGKMP